MEKLTLPDIEKVGIATITGISVETFQTEVKQWLAEAKTSTLEETLYRSDLPAHAGGLNYLRANGYKTYIVTGGGQDFVRVVRGADVRHSARAGRRHGARDQVWL